MKVQTVMALLSVPPALHCSVSPVTHMPQLIPGLQETSSADLPADGNPSV